MKNALGNLVIIILYLDRCVVSEAYGGTIYLLLSVIFFSQANWFLASNFLQEGK